MNKEIGSEFHWQDFELGQGLSMPRRGSLLFSGRTAIESVINESSNIRSVLVPSYCCESMLVPFKKKGIDIKFFDVVFNNQLSISIDDTADALLWCDYFGFKNELPDFDGIIIEDISHSLLSEKQYHDRSNYLVASLRKWEPILCGGYASVQVDGDEPPKTFLAKKKEAMKFKKQYLQTSDKVLKEKYLGIYKESNQWLAENYCGLSIDNYSRTYLEHVNVEKQRAIRRNNAKVLYEGLNDKVQFMFLEEDMDVPLYVPIILPMNRDAIRQHLINHDIYCPVHWPHPDADCESNLYDIELSLVCDQRYDESDMERIVFTLKEVL